jgi:pyridoxal 5'-phosphate synthase pdxT subunit
LIHPAEISTNDINDNFVYCNSGKPVWGTCAGMILLSNTALLQCNGGQALVGGLDIEVCRNFFGSQVQSCEMNVDASIFQDSAVEAPFSAASLGVFIRAPAVLKVGPGVSVLARVKARPSAAALKVVLHSKTQPKAVCENKEGDDASVSKRVKLGHVDLMPVGVAAGEALWDVAVAVRQGNLVATAFHPEFTPNDLRWHQYFVSMVQDFCNRQCT